MKSKVPSTEVLCGLTQINIYFKGEVQTDEERLLTSLFTFPFQVSGPSKRGEPPPCYYPSPAQALNPSSKSTVL